MWDSSWDAGEGFGGESGKEMVQSNVRVHPSSPPFISDLNVTCPENSKLLEALLTLSIAHSALVPGVSWARSRDRDRCRSHQLHTGASPREADVSIPTSWLPLNIRKPLAGLS